MSAEGAEKRRHLRLSAMGPVEVHVKGSPPQEGYLASIGRGGLGLYLREKVEPAQLVLVNLRVQGDEEGAEELKVAARVRWSRPAGQLHMMGLAFEQMSDARFSRLLGHLRIIERMQLGLRAEPADEGRPRLSVKD